MTIKTKDFDTFSQGIVSSTSSSGPFKRIIVALKILNVVHLRLKNLDIKAEKVYGGQTKSKKKSVQGKALHQRCLRPLYFPSNQTLRKIFALKQRKHFSGLTKLFLIGFSESSLSIGIGGTRHLHGERVDFVGPLDCLRFSCCGQAGVD